MKPSIHPGVSLLLVLYCIAANLCPVNGKVIMNKNLQCVCGVPDPADRILGGVVAGYNEFPWQALILYRNQLLCGGTVINDRYILTAGHCVHKKPNRLLKVVLGAYHKSLRYWWREKVFSVSAKKIHERYISYEDRDVRDIALLQLNEKILFNSYTRPVCLPRQGENFYGKFATVTGWGLTKNNGSTSNYLRKTAIRVMPNKECLRSRLGNFVAEDPKSMMCAYATNKDSCQGDSGGPLAYMSPDGKTTQIGIVSFGYECGVLGYPGIYTKLSTFRNWIVKNTVDADYCRF